MPLLPKRCWGYPPPLKDPLRDRLIGHISRDGTAIEAREKPAKKVGMPKPAPPEKKKRGRPQKGEIREVKPGKLERQQGSPWRNSCRNCRETATGAASVTHKATSCIWIWRELHLDTVAVQQQSLCALVLPSGMRLEMSALLSPEWLAALVRAAHVTQGVH